MFVRILSGNNLKLTRIKLFPLTGLLILRSKGLAMKQVSAIIFSFIFLSSCTGLKRQSVNIKDKKAEGLIEKSIAAYGGLENWNSIENLSFDKWYALYDADGNEEVNVNQKHRYNPEKIYISWDSGEDKMEQTRVGDEFVRMKNGKPDESAKPASVKNSILASTFVMNFPYNLLDDGVRISYDGETTFMDKAVHIIKAEYFPETESHHTTKDIWWHYIDQESHLALGYKVKHLDHISLVKNTSFNRLEDFVFPGKRESFRVNEEGEELYLRAKYDYSNFSVVK